MTEIYVCPNCNLEDETPFHYFFTCPAYQGACQHFLNEIRGIPGVNTANTESHMNKLLDGAGLHQCNLPTLYQNMIDTVTF